MTDRLRCEKCGAIESAATEMFECTKCGRVVCKAHVLREQELYTSVHHDDNGAPVRRSSTFNGCALCLASQLQAHEETNRRFRREHARRTTEWLQGVGILALCAGGGAFVYWTGQSPWWYGLVGVFAISGLMRIAHE